MVIRRVIGSTRLHNLAARNNLVFNCTPSGNKLVGIHNRMGMKFASKFIGALVVKCVSYWGGDKDALYRWASMGGSFLNARGRTASVDLSN
eukprot:1154329-Pelagomonas_calceolata.AAC.1